MPVDVVSVHALVVALIVTVFLVAGIDLGVAAVIRAQKESTPDGSPD